MYVQGEPVHAFCPLNNAPSGTSRAYLTSESFIVIRKGNVHSFKKSSIRQIILRERMYLIPVIAGGIMAPLGIVALINDLGYLWLIMLVIFTGLLLLYYGIQGGPALTVITPVKEYDIFIPAITPQLQSFTAYANWQVRSSDDLLYITLDPGELEQAASSGVTKGKRVYLSTEDVPASLQDRIWIIDTTRQHIEFLFEQENAGAPVEIKLGNTVQIENIREL